MGKPHRKFFVFKKVLIVLRGFNQSYVSNYEVEPEDAFVNIKATDDDVSDSTVSFEFKSNFDDGVSHKEYEIKFYYTVYVYDSSVVKTYTSNDGTVSDLSKTIEITNLPEME